MGILTRFLRFLSKDTAFGFDRTRFWPKVTAVEFLDDHKCVFSQRQSCKGSILLQFGHQILKHVTEVGV